MTAFDLSILTGIILFFSSILAGVIVWVLKE
jgi:uncharacterized Tic20 family protein